MYQRDTTSTTGTAIIAPLRPILKAFLTVFSPLTNSKREKIASGKATPIGPFVNAAHVIRIAARNGNPFRPFSLQAKSARSAPAKLVLRIVSTRQVTAERSHSNELRRTRPARSAERSVVRRHRKR
jgi:hypothetical protein